MTSRLVAANPPELSALPRAETHLLTTRAADVAFLVVVYAVDDATVIFFVDFVPVCDVDDTVMVVPVTAVTLPETNAPNPAPFALPPGPPVGAPEGMPLGWVPVVGAPLGRVPPGPPARPAIVQVPVELAAETEIVVAATDDVEVDVPEAMEVTHDPTVTADAVVGTVALMVVELV